MSTVTESWRASEKPRRVLVVIPLLLFLVLPVAIIGYRIQGDEATLNRGVTAEAVVLGVDDSGEADYLTVAIGGGCGCTSRVAVNNLSGHPVGSKIAVRYNPAHPELAKSLVDRPNPYAPILPILAGTAMAVLLLAPLLLLASRRRRRSLDLTKTNIPSMRVRVEAWQRLRSNATLPFLSVYPASSPPGTPPLVVVPTDVRTLARLHDGQTFDLYAVLRDGVVVPGRPLALKDHDVVVATAAKTRPGSWEAGKRLARTDIDLGTPEQADQIRPVGSANEGASLFRDAAEARAWRRSGSYFRWLLPILVLLPFLRVLPYDLLVWSLPAVGIVLIAFYGLVWRSTRLVDRLVRRLPGLPPRNRAERRAARAAARALVASPAGAAEMAALLHTTPERLTYEQKRGTTILVVAGGVASLVLLAVLLRAPFRAGNSSSWSGPGPAIAGAPSYSTFASSRDGSAAPGRPWGRACQPIRLTVEASVPDEIYDQVAMVVTEARRSGVNVTVEDRQFSWDPASLYYPPGTTVDDVRRVPVFTDDDPPPLLDSGLPQRLTITWDTTADRDGRHANLVELYGELHLAALSDNPVGQRTAIRQLVAFAQGVDDTDVQDSGLRRGTVLDGFTADDTAAMQLMSGCGPSAPIPRG